MKKIELTAIVNLINRSEFENFGKYIVSPYFNISQRLINLYNFIDKNFSKIVLGKISREDAAKAVIGNKFSDTALRKLFSDFTAEIHNFMAFNEFKNEPYNKLFYLLNQIKTANNKEHYKIKLKEFKKKFEKIADNELRSKMLSELYWEEYNAEPENIFHKYSGSLQFASDKLDEYYFSRKLLYFQLMFSKQYLNKEDIGYKWYMSDEITGFIEKNSDYIKIALPEIFLKYLMLRMLDFKSDHLITEYYVLIERKSSQFTKQKITDYYSDLYNYFTIRIGRGEIRFRQYLINLVKMLDEKDLLIYEAPGKISYYSFKSITDTCIYLKELTWMEYFINKYKDKLDDVNRNNISNLAYAKLYYFKKEIQKARFSLAKVDYKDYIHYPDAKLFQSCIEYDAENYIEVYLIFDSVKKYLKKNRKIPAHMAESYNRFIQVSDRLIKINEKKSRDTAFQINMLLKELENAEKPVYARNWLLERIKEIHIV
jgi:hypothetical protein